MLEKTEVATGLIRILDAWKNNRAYPEVRPHLVKNNNASAAIRP